MMILGCLSTYSQSNIDSLLLKEYPVIIGNIGFDTDSVEIVVGQIPRGEKSQFNFELFNLGNNPVVFTNGKSNNFISLIFDPVILSSGMTGTMKVEFDADSELDLGDFDVEIAITSDDKQNPYKFLTLLMEIIEGNGGDLGNYDSIPHIVFDHYNHDFGHLKRGKVQYHTFIISNEGGLPLNIIDIQPPKGITIIDAPNQSILPGEKNILRFKINTRGRVGVQHLSIIVRSDDPDNPVVILGLHGSVRVYPSHKKSENQCGEGGQPF